MIKISHSAIARRFNDLLGNYLRGKGDQEMNCDKKSVNERHMTKEQGKKYQMKKTSKNFTLVPVPSYTCLTCPEGPGDILLPSFSKGFMVSKFPCTPTIKPFRSIAWPSFLRDLINISLL